MNARSHERGRRWLLPVALGLSCAAPRVAPEPLQSFAPSSAPASQPVDERAFWSGRRDLIVAPPPQPAAALQTPGLRRLKLKNGIGVLLLPDATLPLSELQLVLRVGAIDDPPDKVGLAEFTVGMLRQGTRRLDADTISETLDSAGVSLGAFSEYELSGLSCSGRSASLDLCLRMLSEIVTQPSFPEKEMEQIRERLLTAIKQTRDDPSSLAEQHFNNLLYGDRHPAGRPLTVESVSRIKREDLLAFYRKHFTPGAALLALSGSFDAATAARRLERAFGAWRGSRPVERRMTPVADPPPGLRVLLIDKPDLSQSFFALGHAGSRLGDPRRDALRAVNYVLGGGGFSSRLMKLVRSEKGKTYGIKSKFDEGSIDGSFLVQSSTRNEELVPTLGLVRGELARIAREPPSEAELRAAKGDLSGGFSIRFQTASRVVGQLMRVQQLGFPDELVTEFPLRIERLTREQTSAAARSGVRADRLVAAVVGKAAVVGPALRAAGIPFEQVSFLAPISAEERRRAASPSSAPEVSEAEQKQARGLLERALRAAGGKARLSLIRSLRLVGKGKIEDVEGDYSVLLLLPDHLRISFEFQQAQTGMVQILAGKQGFVGAGRARKALPAEVVARMRGMIWRDPVLLPLHALEEGVRSRPGADRELGKGLPRGGVAIDLFPPGLPATTIVVDRKSGALLQIRYRGRSGGWRVTELSDHRRVPGGVLVPHRLTESAPGRRKQTVVFEKVELNPRLEKSAITR
jgi:zinc protease